MEPPNGVPDAWAGDVRIWVLALSDAINISGHKTLLVVDCETVTRKADFKVTVEWVNCNLQQEKGTVKRCSDWA